MSTTLEDRIRATEPGDIPLPDVAALQQAGRRRRHIKRAAASTGVAAVLFGLVATITGLPTGAPRVEPLAPPEGPPPASATPASVEHPPALLEAAEDSPRLLVTADGWEVTFAMIAPGVEESQIDFSDGSGHAELQWSEGDTAGAVVAEHTGDGLVAQQRSVLGQSATVLSGPVPRAEPSPGTGDAQPSSDERERAFLLVFFDGTHTIELLGLVADADAFDGLVESLARVDAATWVSALPPEHAAAADKAAYVATLLGGVPQPRGFDPASFTDGPLENPYQLAGRVIGAVSCGWIGSWVEAVANGDGAAAQAAVDAMGELARSSAVEYLTAEGGYGEVVRQYAAGIAGDGTVMGGRVLTVEESYRDAFGC